MIIALCPSCGKNIHGECRCWEDVRGFLSPVPQPPPVCTGSGYPRAEPDAPFKDIPHGVCGICGQVVALDGQGRTVTHAYVAAPPAGETKP